MAVTSLSRYVPLFLVAVAVLLLAGASRFAMYHSASARYEDCRTLAISNPQKALEKAKAWRASNAASPIAKHCEALALYGLKNYAASADELLALSKEALPHKPNLSQELLLQAVAAYKMAGQAEAATHAITERLELPLPDNNKAELLTQRAQIYRDLRQSGLAAQDAKEALKLVPKNTPTPELPAELHNKNSKSN